MADLRPTIGGRGDGRGQIILVGAFALAVAFVALALVMNAAIYTENLATRSESAETANAHAFHRATAMTASESFSYAHAAHSNHTLLNQSIEDSIEIYHNTTRRQQAANGQLTNVSVAGTNPGVNATADPSPDLKSVGGSNDWMLAKGVSEVHEFQVTVDSWNGTNSDELWITAGGASTWYLNVSYDSGDYAVGVNDAGSYEQCTATATAPVTIDFSKGTVGGTECAALDPATLPASYNVGIRNGSVADGEFTMLVDGAPGNGLDAGQYDEILYSMDIDLVYWSSDVRYRSTIRIGPGDIDG